MTPARRQAFARWLVRRNADPRVSFGFRGEEVLVAIHGWGSLALGASVPGEIPAVVATCDRWEGTHEPERAATVLSRVEPGDEGDACVVTLRSPAPNPALRVHGIRGLDKRVAFAQQEVERVERSTGGLVRGFGKEKREALSTAKRHLREAVRDRKHENEPLCHALEAGTAAFDLRVLRAFMNLAGVRSATLVPNGPCEPGVLRFVGGIAVVMPFRR